MLFSQRAGIKPIKNTIQINSMDNDLKVGLWSALVMHYFDKVQYTSGYYISKNTNVDIYNLCRDL